jgi:hypothetical protein
MKKTLLMILVVAGIGASTLWHLLGGNRLMLPPDQQSRMESPVGVVPSSVVQTLSTQAEEVPASQLSNTEGGTTAIEDLNVTTVTPEETASEPVTPDDIDRLTADFVASGNPAAIQAFFAERRRARAELMQKEMSWESEDPRWSEDLRKKFEDAEKIVPGLSSMVFSDADCRETICAVHVEFVDSDYDALAPYMSNIGMVLGSEAWVHHDAEPNAAVVYIAKPDAKLPGLERSAEG